MLEATLKGLGSSPVVEHLPNMNKVLGKMLTLEKEAGGMGKSALKTSIL